MIAFCPRSLLRKLGFLWRSIIIACCLDDFTLLPRATRQPNCRQAFSMPRFASNGREDLPIFNDAAGTERLILNEDNEIVNQEGDVFSLDRESGEPLDSAKNVVPQPPWVNRIVIREASRLGFATNRDGLFIFTDAAGTERLVLNDANEIVNQAGDVYSLDPASGEPLDNANNAVPQPNGELRHMMKLNMYRFYLERLASGAQNMAVLSEPAEAEGDAKEPGAGDEHAAELMGYPPPCSEYGPDAEVKDYYQEAKRSLYAENEAQFDLSGVRFSSFVERVSDRAGAFGWGDTKGISSCPLSTLQDLMRKILANRNTHACHDDAAFYQCLMESLDRTSLNTIKLRSRDYTIDNEPSGMLLFKVITMLAEDNRETARLQAIRWQWIKLCFVITAAVFLVVFLLFSPQVLGLLDEFGLSRESRSFFWSEARRLMHKWITEDNTMIGDEQRRIEDEL
jgi:hypothetical protein